MVSLPRKVKETISIFATLISLAIPFEPNQINIPLGTKFLYTCSFGRNIREHYNLVWYRGGSSALLKIGDETKELMDETVERILEKEPNLSPERIATRVGKFAWYGCGHDISRTTRFEKKIGAWLKPYRRLKPFDITIPQELSEILQDRKSICYEKSVFIAHTLDRIPEMEDYEIMLGSFVFSKYPVEVNENFQYPNEEDIISAYLDFDRVFHGVVLLINSEKDTLVLDQGRYPVPLEDYSEVKFLPYNQEDFPGQYFYQHRRLFRTTPLEEID